MRLKRFLTSTLLLLLATCLFAQRSKQKIDLPIENDPDKQWFYYNGTGVGGFEYEGDSIIAQIDLDFEHPVDGRYGTLTFTGSDGTTLAQYAFTEVSMYSSGLCARSTVTGINGTTGSCVCNVSFFRDRSQDYQLLFFPDHCIPFLDKENGGYIYFDSDLRIAPKEKTPEQIAYEEKQQAKKEQEEFEETFHNILYTIQHWAILILTLFVAGTKFKQASQRNVLLYLVLFTIMMNISIAGIYLFLPYVPAYAWWYLKLYDNDVSPMKAIDGLKKYGLIGLIVCTCVAYFLVGAMAYLCAAIWFVLGFFTYWLLFFAHTLRHKCPHCGYYASNPVIKSELESVKRYITRTRSSEYSHTEERSDKIIEWYKRYENVKVEDDETYKDTRVCTNCYETYISTHTRTKTISDKKYRI